MRDRGRPRLRRAGRAALQGKYVLVRHSWLLLCVLVVSLAWIKACKPAHHVKTPARDAATLDPAPAPR